MDTSEHTGTAVNGVYLESHMRSFMDSLHEMKKSDVMTDVTLMLPDHSTIQCHKVVLMAASPFFKTMFQSGLNEGADQDVQVDFADADIIRTLVEFFYTGVINVTSNNAKQLIAASNFLCCEQLKAHCEKYLDGNVVSSNCIELYKLAKLYTLSMLLVTAFEFILFHFKEFASMSDFETLTEDELLEIVSNDGLNVKNEDFVFDAVIRWVDADPERRKEAFVRIAPLIRFPFCTPITLSDDICRSSMMISSGCLELSLEALTSPFHYNTRHAIHNARCIPRRAFKGNKKERLIRMIELKSCDKILFSAITRDVYSGQIVKWDNILPNVESRLFNFVVSSTGIYWVDKNDGLHFLDLKTKKIILTPWKAANQKSTLAVIDEKIFAFGGATSATRSLKSVESFNPEEANPKWKPEPEMLHALCGPYVVRFANKVYSFGENVENGSSRVTQEFDLVRGKWRMRSDMPGPCAFGCAVALNDKIFVVRLGGVVGLPVCYSYEPSKDIWKVCAQPNEILVYDNLRTTATTWNGKILLGDRKHMEEYDPTEDTWSIQNQLFSKDTDTYQKVLHTVCF